MTPFSELMAVSVPSGVFKKVPELGCNACIHSQLQLDDCYSFIAEIADTYKTTHDKLSGICAGHIWQPVYVVSKPAKVTGYIPDANPLPEEYRIQDLRTIKIKALYELKKLGAVIEVYTTAGWQITPFITPSTYCRYQINIDNTHENIIKKLEQYLRDNNLEELFSDEAV